MTDECEDLLRNARPEPRAEFVRALEQELLDGASRRRTPRTLLAVAMVACLAAVLVVLGVAGALPTPFGGHDSVRATQDCHTVLVQRVERRPVFSVSRDGELRVRYRTELVRHPVTRCR